MGITNLIVLLGLQSNFSNSGSDLVTTYKKISISKCVFVFLIQLGTFCC